MSDEPERFIDADPRLIDQPKKSTGEFGGARSTGSFGGRPLAPRRTTGRLTTGHLAESTEQEGNEYAELYRRLPSMVVRALYLNGFRNVRQVAETSDEFLRSLRQIGPERLRIIRSAIPYAPPAPPAPRSSGSWQYLAAVEGEAQAEAEPAETQHTGSAESAPQNERPSGPLSADLSDPEVRIKRLETRVAALEEIIDLLVARRDGTPRARLRDRRLTTLSGDEFLAQANE